MLDRAITQNSLADLLAFAAHRARRHMPEGRHMVSLQECIERLTEFAEADEKGDTDAMSDAAAGLCDAASELHYFTDGLETQPYDFRPDRYEEDAA